MSVPLNERDGNFHGDIQKGMDAETAFRAAMEYRGYLVEESSVEEDRHHHIDFHVTVKDKRYSVDVKSIRTPPHGHHADKIAGVELRNVNGDKGWLHGKAHAIAFERRDCFCIVRRARLAEILERPRMETVSAFRDVKPMTIYARPTDNSLVACLPYSFLDARGAILSHVWKKP